VIHLTRPLVGGETIAVSQSVGACSVNDAFSIVVQTP